MKKIKAAFVGIGGYGGTVLREILDRKAEDIEIVAAADPYPQSSALYEELRGMGVPVYTDMERHKRALRKADDGRRARHICFAISAK